MVFFSLHKTANLINGPITGLLILNYGKSTFYIIMTCIAILGSFFFLTLTTPVNVSDDNLQKEVEKEAEKEVEKEIEKEVG